MHNLLTALKQGIKMTKYIINVDFVVEAEDSTEAVDILQGELKSVPLEFVVGHTDFMEETPNRCYVCNKLFSNGDVDLLSDNTTICHTCTAKSKLKRCNVCDKILNPLEAYADEDGILVIDHRCI